MESWKQRLKEILNLKYVQRDSSHLLSDLSQAASVGGKDAHLTRGLRLEHRHFIRAPVDGDARRAEQTRLLAVRFAAEIAQILPYRRRNNIRDFQSIDLDCKLRSSKRAFLSCLFKQGHEVHK